MDKSDQPDPFDLGSASQPDSSSVNPDNSPSEGARQSQVPASAGQGRGEDAGPGPEQEAGQGGPPADPFAPADAGPSAAEPAADTPSGDDDIYRISGDPPEPALTEPALTEPAVSGARAGGDDLPIDYAARLRTNQRHQALAAGMLALPNLFVRSAGTIVLLYGLLTLALITLASLGVLSGLGALVMGVAFAAVQFLLGPWIMDLFLRWLYRLTWVLPEELPEHLRNFVRGVCEQERIGFPDFGIIDDGAPQAFTYGHHPRNARVVISRGLMEILEPDELEAVVAHELGHVRNWDMVLMTVAQLVPLILYSIYDVARRMARHSRGSERKGRGVVVAGQVGAYLLYIISQYIVLWFSRTREYYADRFAGQATGNPNALARALVKIAYGLAGQNLAATGQGRAEAFADEARQDLKDVPVPAAKQRIAGAGALGALNIFDRGAALNLVVCSASDDGGSAVGGPEIDIERVKGAMQWDLWNPWAAWFELHSTHPLVAKRLHYLADQAAAQGQQPWVVFDRHKPESYWDEFLVDVCVTMLPVAGLLAGLAIFVVQSFAAAQAQWHWLGAAATLLGLGLLFKTRFTYRSDLFQHTTTAALLGHVKVSPVRPVPATLTGKIIGKGVPGLIFSDDFVLRDSTGILFLDYNQPLAIWNFLFGLLRAGEYQGQEVCVRGWFRRAPVPYLEIYQLEPADGSVPARTCYSRHAARLFSYVLILGGVAASVYWLVAV